MTSFTEQYPLDDGTAAWCAFALLQGRRVQDIVRVATGDSPGLPDGIEKYTGPTDALRIRLRRECGGSFPKPPGKSGKGGATDLSTPQKRLDFLQGLLDGATPETKLKVFALIEPLQERIAAGMGTGDDVKIEERSLEQLQRDEPLFTELLYLMRTEIVAKGGDVTWDEKSKGGGATEHGKVTLDGQPAGAVPEKLPAPLSQVEMEFTPADRHGGIDGDKIANRPEVNPDAGKPQGYSWSVRSPRSINKPQRLDDLDLGEGNVGGGGDE